MARMVATKAALSIRVDALSDADSKSDENAPSIGVANRAKLESRLRALEHRLGIVSVRSSAADGKKQSKFEMTGNGAGYNDAGDSVQLIPTQTGETSPEKKAKKEKKSKKSDEMDVDAPAAGPSTGGEVDEAEAKRLRKEAKKAAKAAAAGESPHLVPVSRPLSLPVADSFPSSLSVLFVQVSSRSTLLPLPSPPSRRSRRRRSPRRDVLPRSVVRLRLRSRVERRRRAKRRRVRARSLLRLWFSSFLLPSFHFRFLGSSLLFTFSSTFTFVCFSLFFPTTHPSSALVHIIL